MTYFLGERCQVVNTVNIWRGCNGWIWGIIKAEYVKKKILHSEKCTRSQIVNPAVMSKKLSHSIAARTLVYCAIRNEFVSKIFISRQCPKLSWDGRCDNIPFVNDLTLQANWRQQ